MRLPFSLRLFAVEKSLHMIEFSGMSSDTLDKISSAMTESNRKPFSEFAVRASDDEERLVRDLFRDYNKLIRPVEVLNMTVEVEFGLSFIQLINVVSTHRHHQTINRKHWSRGKEENSRLSASRCYAFCASRLPADL